MISELEEAATIDHLFREKNPEQVRFVGHQINTVDGMGHQLMALDGVLLGITATILSATSIKSELSRSLLGVLGAASLLIFLSATVIGVVVFRLAWITSASPNEGSFLADLTVWSLKIRNRKTRWYHAALFLTMAGLFGYLVVILLVIFRQ